MILPPFSTWPIASKKGREAEAEMFHHQDAQDGRAGHQQDRLDDLHPGGRKHSAKDDVDDHQHTHTDDRRAEGNAGKEEFHQAACADHLRDHIESGDGERAQRRHRTDGARTEPIGKEIRHGVFARVAQRLGDDEQYGEVRHQPADRVHESVVAEKGDHPRDAEEARGTHVVARHREAILPPGDAAARGEVGARTLRASRAEVGDYQRRRHERQEHDERGHIQLRCRRCGDRRKKGRSFGEPFRVRCEQFVALPIPFRGHPAVEDRDDPRSEEL
jgi:hypothetical protein